MGLNKEEKKKQMQNIMLNAYSKSIKDIQRG